MTDFNLKIIEIVSTILIAAIVSLITSYRTTKQELKKFPYEIQKVYAETLQKKRIELYPLYYNLVSDLIKKIDRRQIDEIYIREWLNSFMKVDTEVSLFLSGASSNFIYEFYCGVEHIIQLYFENEEITIEEFYSRLNGLGAAKFENHLKKDIGIYIVEFDPKNGKIISTYDEIDRLYNK